MTGRGFTAVVGAWLVAGAAWVAAAPSGDGAHAEEVSSVAVDNHDRETAESAAAGATPPTTDTTSTTHGHGEADVEPQTGTDDDHAAAVEAEHEDDAASGTAVHDHPAGDPTDGMDGGMPAMHDHGDEIVPYPDRVAAATDEEQAAAEQLLADVEATLAAYTDVAAAEAAGFVAPPSPTGPMHHYRSQANVRDDVALDPSAPEGLVYFVRDGMEPVLVGALFIARPGEVAPMPGGVITQWHTHDETCGSFVLDAGECEGSPRMFHVWATDARTVLDPFGVSAGVAFGRRN